MVEYDKRIGGSEFHGLLVKLSADVLGGKLYLIPETSLAQFEFTPTNVAAFNDEFSSNKLVNVDYAAYLPGLHILGSSHG